MEQKDWLERHEKFVAFTLLGAALFAMGIMVYVKPPEKGVDGAALAILNTIVGALTLAFGGAANGLFKIITDSDRKQIGQEAANAVSQGPPTKTEVVNKEPIEVKDTTTQDETLPPMFKEDTNG